MIHSNPSQLAEALRDRYTIHREIGRGGMATVYLASDLRHDRPVALKVLLPELSATLGPGRFVQEIQVTATLQHPHILPLYDSGEAGGLLYYVVPFVAGGSLRDVLSLEHQLPLADVLSLVRTVAVALDYAHGRGVVHRDIKPENILMQEGQPLLADFGIALAVRQAGGDRLTATGLSLGTPQYMSPEQATGDRGLGPQSDIYSLAAVAYELLVGEPPITGPTGKAVLARVVLDLPRPIRTVRANVPDGVEAAILKALAKVPADRFRSAGEFASAVDSSASSAPHRGSKLGRRTTSFRALKRRLSLPMVTLAALAIVAIGAGLWWARRITSSTAAPRAVAILPFDQSDDESGYLTAGLTDGITTELSRVRNIVVPGYVTAGRYRGSAKPLKQVAAELEVDAVLRGRVEQVGQRVTVDAQLLDADGGKQLWARRYERPLRELLEIQRDVTRDLLATLRIRLTEEERTRLDQSVIANPRAYDRYLQARAIELGGLSYQLWIPIARDSLRVAQSLYSQARDLDPNFAVARARLALMLTYGANLYNTTDARREQARLEAEAALRLQPGLPEAHQALANYWHQRGNLVKSVDELKLALAGFPNSSELRLDLGNAYAEAGRLEDAVTEFERAMRLEPGSPKVAFNAAVFYLRLRRDEDAMRAFDHAIALAPDYHMVKVIKGHTYLRWKGIPDTLADAMRTIPAEWDPSGMATYARYTVLRAQRRYDEALAMLDRSGIELSRDGYVYQPVSLMRAQLYEARGDSTKARVNYVVARGLLRDSVNAHPDDASMRVSPRPGIRGTGTTEPGRARGPPSDGAGARRIEHARGNCLHGWGGRSVL